MMRINCVYVRKKNTVDFAVRFNAQIQEKKLFHTKNKQIDPSFDHATHVEPSCILGQSICCGFHFIQKVKKNIGNLQNGN